MENNNYKSLSDCFTYSKEIILYDDGNATTFQKGDDKYESILSSLLSITEGAHEMPAFGVSLDKETRKVLNDGFWIELVYDSEKTYNEFPFETLLINVHKEHQGFNIIRKVNGKYDGRCFYLDLSSDMSDLFETLTEISKN